MQFTRILTQYARKGLPYLIGGFSGITIATSGYLAYKYDPNRKLELYINLGNTLVHQKEIGRHNMSKWRNPDTMTRDEYNIPDQNVWLRPFLKTSLRLLRPFYNVMIYSGQTPSDDPNALNYPKQILDDFNLGDYLQPLPECDPKHNYYVQVDDSWDNRQAREFHHIAPYRVYSKNDYELLKLSIELIAFYYKKL